MTTTASFPKVQDLGETDAPRSRWWSLLGRDFLPAFGGRFATGVHHAAWLF